MLKKVVLTNIYTSKSTEVIVDTEDDSKAVLGSGKAPNETAVVSDITGANELVERLTGYKPRWFTYFIGDAHIYENHLDMLQEQLKREPFPARC